MANKKGRSEKKTDWLGRSYIQHYDSKGNKSGRSERKETLFGKQYTQHYSAKGEKAGRSEKKETWIGRKYTQKYNAKGEKSGTSEKREGWFGNKYTQHYDNKGNKTDWSERKESFFGTKYVQRYGDERNTGTASPGSSRSNEQVRNYSSSGSSNSTSVTTATSHHTSRDSALGGHASKGRLGIASGLVIFCLALFAIFIIVRVQPRNPPHVASAVKSAGIYKGTINNKYKVEMNLRREGHTLSGTYVYLKYNIPIELRGTIDQSNTVVIYGYDRSGKLIDTFNGVLGGNGITGTFTRQKDMKKMPFQLSR